MLDKMSKASFDNNNLPIGQSISKCKEDIRSILYRLKDVYEPCDLDTARGFSKNLIQSINKVFDEFIDDIEQGNRSNVISANGVVKNEDGFQTIVISDSEDEPEMEKKIECSEYNEAPYETSSPTVIDLVAREQPCIDVDSMDISSSNDVANTSTSENGSSFPKKSTHKMAVDVPINKSKNFKDKYMEFDASNNKSFDKKQCEVCQKGFPNQRLFFLNNFPIHLIPTKNKDHFMKIIATRGDMSAIFPNEHL